MKNSVYIIGIDAGSVSASIAGFTAKGDLVFHDTAYHHGEVMTVVSNLLTAHPIETTAWVATTSSSPDFIVSDGRVDDQVAMLRAARKIHPGQFSALLHVGGERFSLSRFDSQGNYTGARHNSSCAAGTGSFLDQQAGRLRLSGSEKISQMALENTKDRPDIATRCAVFAKTDLIHAQQEGYDIPQICDGLCYGLAKNIANTLFKQTIPEGNLIFCGGVSKNDAVRRHLEQLLDLSLVTDAFSMAYGAMGAALTLLDQVGDTHSTGRYSSPEAFFQDQEQKQGYRYPELLLTLSEYPDFTAFRSYNAHGVEVDIYRDPSDADLFHGYLGVDVGSTSTKSILIDQDGAPLAGFYTKTASRPVQAVQFLFRALDEFLTDYFLDLPIKGCGTTGSGRRISAKIIGADIEPDEITAHAAAAVNLNPDVDTIIEIGGQDAKFTLLKDGVVTSSVMNTVCAAGTGSFIEEQAAKLECPLSEYSGRTEGVTSPVSSDRCTVFMERDINYFFAEGYEKNEILASVLHSVRDNYLTKVANPAKIGNQVLFQGATARNKALVAAFEQKLGKPIHVSRYCHLTGALGVALLAKDAADAGRLEASQFRGFNLWQDTIPVRKEVCQLCTNHCKITIAEINGSPQAYGFLCGRDYETQKRGTIKNRYDLLDLRRKVLKVDKGPVRYPDITVGLPDALHMSQDLPFWERFFNSLGVKIRTSRNLKDPVKRGKRIAGAEFCSPVVAMHGHVSWLLEKTDFVFLPFYFEDRNREKDRRRQHCYYTQFTPAVFSGLFDTRRVLSPMVKYLYTSFHEKLQIYNCLKSAFPKPFSFFDISQAFDRAAALQKQQESRLQQIYNQARASQPNDQVRVLLLGRPYTVLSKAMNSNIPGIFSNLGIQTFFQDMLDFSAYDFTEIDPLLQQIHWKHAAQILKAAYVAAKEDNLYPVYISSFNCSPDAFGTDYFKEIMEGFGKPYLVLELDEHDSSMGYETRIEAAVQAFSNHLQMQKKLPPLLPQDRAAQFTPRQTRTPGEKTIVYPNWDSLTGHFIVNILKHEGYEAVLMEENQETLKKSLLTNTGQCLPLNAVAAGFIHTVDRLGLDPSSTVLWLNKSEIACNIKMYPYHIQKILEREGRGFEASEVYIGELSLFDISFNASKQTYFAYMFGGLFRSIACKVRPYEVNKGDTDRVLDAARKIMGSAFLTSGSKDKALKEIISRFMDICVEKQAQRPKVAIFGDLYVRDNATMNQDLIRFIEDNGGEVVSTPYYQYVQIIAKSYFKKWFKEGKYLSLISHSALLAALKAMEKKYYPLFAPFFNETDLKVSGSYEDILQDYGLLPEHTGESMDNLLKIHHIVKEHPDLSLLVQANPAFCCPGLITEAMAEQIEKKVKVPIVSITYDLSGGNKNRVIVPFLSPMGRAGYCQSLKVSV